MHDAKIYGYGVREILIVDNWLRCQNATIDDLECSTLNRHYWEKARIGDLLTKEWI